jgi:AcrR family transcriptional regulator
VAVAVEGETREALLDAAEALFAAEGNGGVSLAANTRLAGQHNGGAIHYYFGDGLLAAILDRPIPRPGSRLGLPLTLQTSEPH